jgi:hypothetical protein
MDKFKQYPDGYPDKEYSPKNKPLSGYEFLCFKLHTFLSLIKTNYSVSLKKYIKKIPTAKKGRDKNIGTMIGK